MLENDPIDMAIEAMQNAPEPPAIPPLGIITPTFSTPVFDDSGADPVVTLVDGQLTLVGSQPLGSQIGSQPVVVSASTSAAADTRIDATINQLFNGPPTPVVVLTPIVFLNTPSPPPLPPLTPINVTFASDDPPPIVSPFSLPAVTPIPTVLPEAPLASTSTEANPPEAEGPLSEIWEQLEQTLLFENTMPILIVPNAGPAGSTVVITLAIEGPFTNQNTFQLFTPPTNSLVVWGETQPEATIVTPMIGFLTPVWQPSLSSLPSLIFPQAQGFSFLGGSLSNAGPAIGLSTTTGVILTPPADRLIP